MPNPSGNGYQVTIFLRCYAREWTVRIYLKVYHHVSPAQLWYESHGIVIGLGKQFKFPKNIPRHSVLQNGEDIRKIFEYATKHARHHRDGASLAIVGNGLKDRFERLFGNWTGQEIYNRIKSFVSRGDEHLFHTELALDRLKRIKWDITPLH